MKAKLHYNLLVVLLLLSQLLQAQWQNGLWTEKQAYNWYFNFNAGLNFETSPPTALIDSEVFAESGTEDLYMEGVSTISDSSGNLLFYTNGQTIWNSDHEVMENGTEINGSPSSTQGALIIQKPEEPSKYYLFTVGLEVPFSYSIIDMELDNGFGAVTEKNIIIQEGEFSEKFASIHHADKDKIWLTIHSQEGNTFYSFLVSDSGISNEPVISNIGIDYQSNSSVGQMKFSADGSKLAHAYIFDFISFFEVFTFNNETGEVTNIIFTMDDAFVLGDPTGTYGVEFSPNSRFLYVSTFFLGGIFQFDLQYDTLDEIIGSAVQLKVGNNYGSSLQTGPDGKIYAANLLQSEVDVIDYPNNPGLAAGYNTNGAVSLAGSECGFGLPNFVQSYFESGILYEVGCPEEGTTFTTIRIPGITEIVWNFGDPDSGADNISTDLEPSHAFNVPGTYTVTALITSNGAQQTVTTEVVVEVPDATIPAANNLSLCDDSSGTATFDLTVNNTEILNGQDDAVFAVIHYASEADALAGNPIATPEAFTTPGQDIYTEVVNTETGCSTLISYTLVVNPLPDATAPQTIEQCGDMDGITIVNLTDYESIILSGQDPSVFSVTYFDNLSLAESGIDPLETQAYATAGGTLYARVTNLVSGCYNIVSFDILVHFGISIPESLNFLGCSPFDLTESVAEFDQNLTYSYYTNEEDAMAGSEAIVAPEEYLLSTESGYVYIRAESTEGCFDVAELMLEIGDCTLPRGISPNNDGLNDSFDLTFLTGKGNGSLQVFNRYGIQVYEQSSYTNQWKGQDSRGNELPTGTYYYVLRMDVPHPDFGSVISRWVYVQREY